MKAGLWIVSLELFACSDSLRRYNITFDQISGDARLVGSVEAVEMEIEFSTTDASVLFLGEMHSDFAHTEGYNVSFWNTHGVTTFFREQNTVVIESGDAWSNKLQLGIGPESSLVRQLGSVNLIKKSERYGEIQIATSEDFFLSQCVPDSTIQAPFTESYGFSGTVIAKYRLIHDVSSYPLSLTRPEPFRVASPVGISVGSKLLSIPYDIGGILDRMILALGAVESPEVFATYKYRRCPSDVEFLPSIGLNFFQDDHRTRVGELILSPKDYLARMGDGDCAFRFRPVGPGTRWLYFRPWRLTGVNIRVTSTEMLLCDSLTMP